MIVEQADTDVATRQLWSHTVAIADDRAAEVMTAGELCWLAPTVELAGWGEALRIPVDGVDARDGAAATVARHLSQIAGDASTPGPVAFASLAFDPHSPGSVLVVPRTTVRRSGGRAWLTVVDDRPIAAGDLHVPSAPRPSEPTGRVRYAGATAAEIAWIEAVDRAVRRIRAGDIEKVVLARDRVVSSDRAFDLPRILGRLRERFSSCYTFRVDGLIGASPELLIRRDGADISSLVLAGTARRGATAEEDHRIGAQLLSSAKDLAEHRPAVASVRATLGPLVSDLDIEEQPHLLRLANVQHLATRVTGRLHTPADALALAVRLHPTAAVGGTPTDRALQVIAELETIDRARYAGPVGWVDASGDGEFAIALRCAQFDGTTARLFAGGGIVADSLPEAELEETRLKLRAMQAALGDDA
ncbi:isochorismate synthase [soil metagenome]